MFSHIFRHLGNTRISFKHARRKIHVLGIESSCDDTSAAVVNDSKEILGQGHFSQSRIHLEAGGIIPSLAYNLHSQYLKDVVNTSIQSSKIDFKDLNAIAVTVKPGLNLSLRAGLEFAKDLCVLYSKPLIPVHHMEAHALTARLIDDVKFPFLVLLISGGHCILALAKSVDQFYTLGSSEASSPGQLFDRIARRAKLKNLKKYRGLIGGAAIEIAAQNGDSTKFNFQNAVRGFPYKTCKFTFSGFNMLAKKYLKEEEQRKNLGPDEVIQNVNDFCASLLFSVASHLCQRLEVAINYVQMKNLLDNSEKCLVLSGGVACNQFIQKAVKKVCDKYDYKFVVPPAKLCTDNGAMIAWNGIERLKANLPAVQPGNLSTVVEKASCPLGEDLSGDVEDLGRQMTFNYLTLKSYSEVVR